MKIKIAIIDDHPMMLKGIGHLINGRPDMEITGSYHTGEELLKMLKVMQPDVLLLDVQLQGKTSEDIVEKVRNLYPEIKILALTNYDNIFYVKSMLKKGVNGYILKTADELNLIDAIQKVAAGVFYLEPILKDKVLLDSLQSRQFSAREPVISRIEKDILQCIAADMTSQQIAEKMFLSKRTIDNYRINLLTKLGVKNPAGLIKKAIQMGLID